MEKAQSLAADVERLKREVIGAIRSKDVSRVKELLDRNAGLVNARTESGETLVLMAAYYGAREVADLLRARGAELNLFEAAALGETGRIQALLEDHPDQVNAHSHDGWTPLHLAAHFGHREAAEFLLARGADVQARSRNRMNNTPLHAALAGVRQNPVVELLGAHGADLNAADGAGWRPLHLAAHNGEKEAVAYLLAHGAHPDAKNEAGQTPLELAHAEGHEAVAELLRASRVRTPKEPEEGAAKK